MSALRLSAPFGIALLILSLSPLSAGAQANEALLGKWRLIAAQSKYSPGPVPKSLILTYAMSGNCLTALAETVEASGAQTRVEFTCLTPDEREYPVKGSPAFDSSSYKRVDALTTAITRKKAGKVVETGTRAVSKDGNTLTITLQGTSATGQKYNNVSVYEKS